MSSAVVGTGSRPVRLTETLALGGGLSLAPRLKLLLTFFRADLTVRPLDEWQLKVTLLAFLRAAPLSLPVADDGDLRVRRLPELNKRRRDEPVATGSLHLRDLSDVGADEESQFIEWRQSVIDRLEGIDLNLEGVKFRMSVELPAADDFQQMEKSWGGGTTSRLLNGRSFSARGISDRPDTIIVSGLPSRWFAEPRISSKPSLLVTHTIFSTLGKIRNLHVAANDGTIEKDEAKGDPISGLNCKVWVQFESYNVFYNAMKVLCGRSLQKEGSRLKVDYELTWDGDNFFKNVLQKSTRSHVHYAVSREHDAKRTFHESQALRNDFDISHRKRFRD